MVDLGSLPNFFIIGAPKAGTTSLFNTLSKSSEIFPAAIKDVGFFNNDEKYHKGLNWYQQTYFKGSSSFPVRMDATPAYLTWSEKTAHRLKSEYPLTDLKFAAIFRDPVQRAYSHYWHRVRLGHENLSFKEAIQAEPERLTENYDELYRKGDGRYGYFRAGCYTSRLKPFLDRFNNNQFMFLLQEDLMPDVFLTTMARVQDFLGITQKENPTFQKANQASSTRWGWMESPYSILKRSFLGKLYRSAISDSIRIRVHDYLFPPASYPPIDPDLAADLRARYFDEIKALEQLIHRDLSAWIRT